MTQQKANWSFVHQSQLIADERSGLAGEALELFRPAANEKDRISNRQIELAADRRGTLRTEVFGDGTSSALLALPPEYVSKSRLPLALSPSVHAIAKGARAASGRRYRPHFYRRIRSDQIGKHFEAGAGKMIGDRLQDEWIAQIGLVGTVFTKRLTVRDAGKGPGHRLAVAELLEQTA